VAKKVAKVLSSMLLFQPTRMSRWRMPVLLSAKKIPAPLWPSNWLLRIETSLAPSLE